MQRCSQGWWFFKITKNCRVTVTNKNGKITAKLPVVDALGIQFHLAQKVLNFRPKTDVSWSRRTYTHVAGYNRPHHHVWPKNLQFHIVFTDQIQALQKRKSGSPVLDASIPILHIFHTMPGPFIRSPGGASQRRLRACSPEIALLKSIFKDCR